jgi:S1-C subfamily serine protease
MNFFSKFSAMAIGTLAIAISTPVITIALEATQIYDLAQRITVLVDGQNPGSGVIIAKQRQTYYVLTAKHVVATEDEYEIVTSDRQRYRLNYSLVKKLPEIDLALIQFNSDREYTLAQLTDPKQAKPGTVVHIYGFPKNAFMFKQLVSFSVTIALGTVFFNLALGSTIAQQQTEASIAEDALSTRKGISWGGGNFPYSQVVAIQDSLVNAPVGRVVLDKHGVDESSSGLILSKITINSF